MAGNKPENGAEEEIELEEEEEEDSVCPNCGQSTEGEDTCPYCGAILNDDDELDPFVEDDNAY